MKTMPANSIDLSPLDARILSQLPRSLLSGYTNMQLRNYVGRLTVTQQQMTRALKSLEQRGLVQQKWYKRWRCTELGDLARKQIGGDP